MEHFHIHEGELHCEQVRVSDIARAAGTPLYVYSQATLQEAFQTFDGAFREVPHLTCFAVKANANLAVLNILAREGSGADIVSGGELFRVLEAGFPPERIVYAGVGKTRQEIREALEAGILMFNVESREELHALDEVAGTLGTQAPIALRVNPDVDARTHPYIATGLKEYKFGIAMDLALEFYQEAARLPHVEIVGIHQHIGSQLTQIQPFVDSLKQTFSLVETLRSRKIPVRYVDIGGGLGITYQNESPPQPRDLAQAVLPLLKPTGCTLILEPGRAIVGNAGILVTRVLYRKETGHKTFLIVDAAMNDLARPSLYDAYHGIEAVRQVHSRETRIADVVGPICESGDFLARNRKMPDVRSGELLAVMSAGAYGFTMSSNYNSRPRIPEVLVKGNVFNVVRERETYKDLIRGERIPVQV